MRDKFSTLVFILIIWIMAMVPALAAETSQVIPFTGCDPALSADVNVRFRIFTSWNGTNMIFEETQTLTADNYGCIQTHLGDWTDGGIPPAIFVDNPSLWIAFALDSDPDTELGGGRTAIMGNGYAFRAMRADEATLAAQATLALTAQTATTFDAGASVSGTSTTPILLLSNSGAGYGLQGSSTGAVGIYGASSGGGTGSAGVYGLSTADGGNGVVGEANTGFGYGVWGKSSSAVGVVGESSASNGRGVVGVADTGTGAFGVQGISAAGIGVWGGSTNGTGVSGTGPTGVQGTSTSNGGDGVVGTSTSGHGMVGTGPTGVYGIATGPNGNGVIGEAHNGSAAYGIWGKSTSGFAGYFDGKVQVNGNMAARVVQITGGSDLSEKFAVRDTQKGIEPGMVVAIDPEHPGKLTISAEPYSRKVAGVISGAGGVNPGLLMGQSGSVADGSYPVALTGRVYCWAEASNGPIQAGDLLTTSATPGHAMKVKNYGKAQGAILGKAMTSLPKGRGLVLVLVTLQ